MNLKDFREREDVRILISTTLTGGIGLNLTAANKAIICEPWWNEALDQQAFARMWRLGQTRETECVRLYMKGSIDTHKIEVRDGKTERIAKLAMNGELKRYVRRCDVGNY